MAWPGHSRGVAWAWHGMCELALMVLFTKTMAALKWDPSLSSNGIISIGEDGCIEVGSFNLI